MEKRTFIGNNKHITIEENRKHTIIIGNDNKIDVKRNWGTVKVIGNSSRVKILENIGSVTYIGNNGQVFIGSGSNTNQIKYTGSNGVMKFFNKIQLWTKN